MNIKTHSKGLKASVTHAPADKASGKGGKVIKAGTPVTVPTFPDVPPLREAFKALHGRDCTLTDAVIQKMWDDADEGIGPDEMLAVEGTGNAADDTDAAVAAKVKGVSITNPDAQAVATALKASPAVLSAVHKFIEVRSAGVRLVAEMGFALYYAWGGTHEAIKNYLSSRPIPGSRHIEGKPGFVMMGTGDAKYELASQAPADQMKAGELTYWGEVADAISPDAQEALTKLSELAKHGTSDAPAWVKDLDGHDKDGAKVYWQGRRSNAGRILRDGVNLLRRMCIDVPADTQLRVLWRTKVLEGGAQALRDHTSLFINVRYVDAGGNPHDNPFSTASFMAVDLAKVKAFTTAADQWRNFTVDREPRGDGNDNGKQVFVVRNVTDALQGLEELSGFLRSTTGAGELVLALNKAGSDVWVKDLFTLADAINRIRDRSDMQTRFATIMATETPKTGTQG